LQSLACNRSVLEFQTIQDETTHPYEASCTAEFLSLRINPARNRKRFFALKFLCIATVILLYSGEREEGDLKVR
jgi:hypothetical protein